MKHKVLISGAGISGLCAAYWFIQQGWEVVVVEKAAQLRRGEFVIDFAGTGWDVATRMGITPAIEARRSPLKELRFADGQGRSVASLALSDFVDALGVRGKHASINRKDLMELLYNKVKDTAEFRFSTSVEHIEQDETKAMVTLSDAAPERFDLVVGADGLHSKVRSLVFGPEDNYARYLGYQVCAFRVDGISSSEPGVMNLLRQKSRQAGILNLGQGANLALFVWGDPVGNKVPQDRRKSTLAETFRDMGAMVPEIIDAIDESKPLYLDTVTQIEMPKWHKLRTVLVGDAAYCMTLVSGQGASMAMGGAYFLGQALANNPDLDQALGDYEQRVRPFVEGLQKKTRRLAGSFVPSGSLGLLVSGWGMRAMGVGWIRNLAASRMNVRSLLEAA